MTAKLRWSMSKEVELIQDDVQRVYGDVEVGRGDVKIRPGDVKICRGNVKGVGRDDDKQGQRVELWILSQTG
jgi:hypothetical protein